MLLSSVSISTALCCAGRCRPTRTNRRHLCCRSSGKSAGRRRFRRTRCPWRARAERSSEVYRCSGGNDQLAECLKKEIEERGGRVQLPRPASKKMLDSNDICVRAKGEDYRGKWVVVAVPPPAGTLWNSRSTPLHIASLPVLHSSSSRTRKNDFGCATVSLQTPRICTNQMDGSSGLANINDAAATQSLRICLDHSSACCRAKKKFSTHRTLLPNCVWPSS